LQLSKISALPAIIIPFLVENKKAPTGALTIIHIKTFMDTPKCSYMLQGV
jgi:hypothetical protein